MTRKKPEVGFKRKDKTMTVKEAMLKVCDDAATFPKGWNTQVAEVIRANGGECYERRQKKIWMLTIREDDADTDVSSTVYRTLEGAKAAMESDIRRTFDERYDNIAIESVVTRDGELHAKMDGDRVDWRITRETLWD